MEVTISPILLAIIVAITLMFSGTIYILLKKNTHLEESNDKLISIKNDLVTQNNSKLSKITELSNELIITKKDFREATDRWVKEEKDYSKEINRLDKKENTLSTELSNVLNSLQVNEDALKTSKNNYNLLFKQHELCSIKIEELSKDNQTYSKDVDTLEIKVRTLEENLDKEKLKSKSLVDSCDNYIQEIKQIKKELASTRGANTKLKTEIERLKKSSK